MEDSSCVYPCKELAEFPSVTLESRPLAVAAVRLALPPREVSCGALMRTSTLRESFVALSDDVSVRTSATHTNLTTGDSCFKLGPLYAESQERSGTAPALQAMCRRHEDYQYRKAGIDRGSLPLNGCVRLGIQPTSPPMGDRARWVRRQTCGTGSAWPLGDGRNQSPTGRSRKPHQECRTTIARNERLFARPCSIWKRLEEWCCQTSTCVLSPSPGW